MFGPRSPRYPMLQAYLAARAPAPVLAVSDRASVTVGAVLSASGAAITAYFHEPALLVGALVGLAGYLGFKAYRTQPALPPSPEQELARRADIVAAELKKYAYLHRAFHPAVGATLEECATFAARVRAALGDENWDHRDELRANALAAVKVAMDEAIVHAGATLPFNRPTRPMEHVSDALEDIGFGPLVQSERKHEPMPPAFRPVRELAERLRELAERCETASLQRPQSDEEPVSAAFRHLDATLGEMRRLEEAETELRQGA